MPAAKLERGLAALDVRLDPAARDRLMAFLALLKKWNRVQNLTAIRDTAQMVSQHLLDCLAVLPHVHGTRIADVGSGGGFPGIPFAIARGDWQVALIESNHKKCAFLRQAAIELELKNLEVVAERAESYHPARGFDTVISRAFADLPEFAGVAGHLLTPEGALMAMKGVYPNEEIAQLPPPYNVRSVVELEVPGLAAKRHLVIVGKS